jgi:hypothetical protein
MGDCDHFLSSFCPRVRSVLAECASGDWPMIFLRRLGIVLYWIGYAFAILFAIVSLLYALNGLRFGGQISDAGIFAVFSVVSWLWGRAMRYILAGV